MYADVRKDRSAGRCDATTAFDEACGSEHHKVLTTNAEPPEAAKAQVRAAKRLRTYLKFGAGNGIRTRDFDLGKVALYH